MIEVSTFVLYNGVMNILKMSVASCSVELLLDIPLYYWTLFSNIPMWQLCLFATDVSAYSYKHSCVYKCTHCELILTQAGLQHGCLHFNFYFDTYKIWQTVE